MQHLYSVQWLNNMYVAIATSPYMACEQSTACRWIEPLLYTLHGDGIADCRVRMQRDAGAGDL